MIMFLQRQLELTPDQVRHFKAALSRRDGKVDEVRRNVRDSGIFDTKSIRFRLKGIVKESYDEMGLVLDVFQPEAFREIQAEGRFGDSVTVGIPEGVAVID